MKTIRLLSIGLFLLLFMVFSCTPESSSNSIQKEQKLEADTSSIGPVLVIHGGAGNILRKNFTQAQEEDYKNTLSLALETGYSILENGGSSGEAVVKAIQVLEENALFNAGVGAVLTHEKTISLDASFMDGATGKAGAVSGINKVKSPIELAYTIMNHSPHVMLSGKGAEQFAELHGLASVAPEYFITQSKLNQINKVLSQKD